MTAIDTRPRMGELSGAMVDAHALLVEKSARQLVGAAVSDMRLANHTQAAADLTADGAAQLEVIAERHRATAQFAAGARTAAAQRTVLAALRSEAAAVSDVVSTTQRRAGEIAGQIRALDYHTTGTQSGPDDTIVGDDHTGPRVQMVDNRVGPLPQDPPPPPPLPPQTGEPIKLPLSPPRVPPPATVIDASPPDDQGPGFHHADPIEQLKYFGEILAGGRLFGASIPVDLATLGLGGTAGLTGGAWMVGDGVDNLGRAK